MGIFDWLLGKKQRANVKGREESETQVRKSGVEPQENVDTDVDKIVHELSGSTELHLSCSHGDVEGVRKLLAQGAKVNITNKWGATALDLTYSSGAGGRHLQVFSEIARLLRAKGGETKKWEGATF